MPTWTDALVLTCEHGGNRVPAAYRSCFADPQANAALASHRGFDPGARELARGLSARLDAPLYIATTTRLLVEPNRSIGHPRLFSEFTARLSAQARRTILERYYCPHREAVEGAIRRLVARRSRVVHVGVHSFAPVWRGEARAADVGLLYDPARSGERRLCAHWKQCLEALAPGLRVRRNYPYRGVSDGLVTQLRTRFSAREYVAIELEVSQALVLAAGTGRRRAIGWFAQSLGEALISIGRSEGVT